MDEMWCEKYRPKTFDDVVGQKQIVEELKSGLGNLPHLLFHGPAGVGKTTMALIIARGIFGDTFRSNFMELNASDERGIQVIREKVKGFAKVKPLSADFKIIFLDEADYLTNDAQASLRRIMETYAKTTRFILSCNYIHKIIGPIQSRCKCYKFEPLSEGEITTFLVNNVIVPEKMDKITSGVISNIVKSCNGDMRRVINEIQAISQLDGVDVNNVKKISGNYILELEDEIERCDFIKARMLIDKMIKEGMDERRLLIELRNTHTSPHGVSLHVVHTNWLLALMKADERLLIGVDRDLVFDGMVIEMLKGGVEKDG